MKKSTKTLPSWTEYFFVHIITIFYSWINKIFVDSVESFSECTKRWLTFTSRSPHDFLFLSFWFVFECWVYGRVLGFHRLITSQHSTDTSRCPMLTPWFFISEFSGTIFPGTIFPGTNFPGINFSGTIFPGFYVYLCIIFLFR